MLDVFLSAFHLFLFILPMRTWRVHGCGRRSSLFNPLFSPLFFFSSRFTARYASGNTRGIFTRVFTALGCARTSEKAGIFRICVTRIANVFHLLLFILPKRTWRVHGCGRRGSRFLTREALFFFPREKHKYRTFETRSSESASHLLREGDPTRRESICSRATVVILRVFFARRVYQQTFNLVARWYTVLRNYIF